MQTISTTYLLSGGATGAFDVESGGVLSVYYGATSSDSIIHGGGAEVDLGTSRGDQVRSGGALDVYGLAEDDTVSAGGVIGLEDEARLHGGVVLSGGRVDLGEGDAVQGVTVSSGGTLALSVSATSGQIIDLPDGARTETLDGFTLKPGALVDATITSVAAGAVVSLGRFDTVEPGCQVLAGGVLEGPGQIAAGDQDTIDAGLISGVSLAEPTSLFVVSGGVAEGVTVHDAEVVIDAAGSASGLRLSGGLMAVESGGQVSGDAVVGTGGLMLVSGAIDSGVRVGSGGYLILDSGGVGPGQTLSGGAMAAVSSVSGAVLSAGAMLGYGDLTISSGATLSLGAQGFAFGLVISSGGLATGGRYFGGLYGEDYGLVSGTLDDAVLEGGQVYDFGAVSDVELTSFAIPGLVGPTAEKPPAAPELVVYHLAQDITVLDGSVDVVSGVVSGVILSGGGLTLSAGTRAISVTVSSGVIVEAASGVVDGAVIAGSGQIDGAILEGAISDGGRIYDFVLASGGTLNVGRTGSAFYGVVHSGGTLSLGRFAMAADITTSAGGRLVDQGTVGESRTQTLAGALTGAGKVVVDAGSLSLLGDDTGFSGTLAILSGGLSLTGDAGRGTGSIQFAASVQLSLADGAQPANGDTFSYKLENFAHTGDALALASLPYHSGAAATVSAGVLRVTDGVHVAYFALTGLIADAYVASEAADGSVRVEPAKLAQAMAGLAPKTAGAVPARRGERDQHTVFLVGDRRS
jgi:hypothetical protein